MNKIESTQEKGFVGSCFIRERSHHDHFDVRIEFACPAPQVDPAHVRHLDVRDDYVSGLLTEHIHGLTPIFSDAHGMAVALKQMRQELPHAQFVVDYEKISHGSNLRRQKSGDRSQNAHQTRQCTIAAEYRSHSRAPSSLTNARVN